MSEPLKQSDKPWSEQYRIVAKQYVDAKAAAKILEETKTAEFSRRVNEVLEADKCPVNRAEAAVKGSDDWMNWLHEMVEARRKADLLSVQLTYIQMRFSEQQDKNATGRAEMKMTR